MNIVSKKLSSLEEPEFTWTVPCHEMMQKSVRKDDTNWTDRDSEDQRHVSCVIVRLGDCVIDVGCAKQDVILSSALQSELYVLNTGGACTIHTSYLDRDRIKRCMTTMGTLIAGAWAGKQLLVVSGTGVIIGENLSEGQSWMIGVGLLVTVGVYCMLFTPANWKKCHKRTRGCISAGLHDFEKFASWNHQPREREVGVSHGILESSCGSSWWCWVHGIVEVRWYSSLWRNAIMSEDQTVCSCDHRVCCELVDWTTGCDDYLYPELLTGGIPNWRSIRVVRTGEKLVELSSEDRDRTSNHDEGEAQQWYDENDAVRKCHGVRWECESSSCEVQSSDWDEFETSSGLRSWQSFKVTMLKPWRELPHVYKVVTQFHSAQTLLSDRWESTYLHLSWLVVTAPFEIKWETIFIRVIACCWSCLSPHVMYI